MMRREIRCEPLEDIRVGTIVGMDSPSYIRTMQQPTNQHFTMRIYST